MKKIIILLIFVFFLISCGNNNYIGFYYPNKNDLSEYIQSPKLNSIEECRNWVKGQGYKEGIGDYECGYKCRYDKNLNMYMCKTTEK